jgi:hypothetical protein
VDTRGRISFCKNLANIFDQAKGGTLIRRLSGGTSLGFFIGQESLTPRIPSIYHPFGCK